MKNAINVKGIELKHSNVLVQLMEIPNYSGGVIKQKNKAFFGEKEVYYMGKIIDVGPDVKQVKKKDYVLFSMLSGYVVYTNTKKEKLSINDLVKVVDEFDLIVRSKMSGMKVENVESLNERIIVDTKEYKKQIKSDSGVVLTEESENDPRQKDLDRGVVVYVPEGCKYKKGDVLYFEKGQGLDMDEIKGDGDYTAIHPRYILFRYKE